MIIGCVQNDGANMGYMGWTGPRIWNRDMYVCMRDRLGVDLGERANEHDVVDEMQCAKKETMRLQRDNTRHARQGNTERANGGQV